MHDRTRVIALLAVLLAVLGLFLWGGRAPKRGPREQPDAAVDAGAPPLVVEEDAGAIEPLAVDAEADAQAALPQAESPVCTDLDHLTSSALRKLEGELPASCRLDVDGLRKAFGVCLPATGGGAWALAVDAGRARPGDDPSRPCEAVYLHVSLVHAEANGNQVRVEPGLATAYTLFPADGGAPFVANVSIVEGADVTRALRVLFLHDLDGDGSPEVVTAVGRAGADGDVVHETWTFKDGKIVPLVIGSDLVADVRDLDGDGAPEPLTLGPYAQVHPVVCPRRAADPLPPMFLARATPDGGRVSGGELATGVEKELLSSVCPEAPALDVVPHDPSGLARFAVCARVWGITSADVERAMGLVCTRWVGPDAECQDTPSCPAWLQKLAETPPRARLR